MELICDAMRGCRSCRRHAKFVKRMGQADHGAAEPATHTNGQENLADSKDFGRFGH